MPVHARSGRHRPDDRVPTAAARRALRLRELYGAPETLWIIGVQSRFMSASMALW